MSWSATSSSGCSTAGSSSGPLILRAGAPSTGRGFPSASRHRFPRSSPGRSSTGRSRRSTRAEPFFSQVYARLFDPDPALAWDVHDDVAAQFLRLRGLMLERAGDVPGAVAELEKALAKGAKVKTALDKLKKKSGA